MMFLCILNIYAHDIHLTINNIVFVKKKKKLTISYHNIYTIIKPYIFSVLNKNYTIPISYINMHVYDDYTKRLHEGTTYNEAYMHYFI
jgi:hypothetical protein